MNKKALREIRDFLKSEKWKKLGPYQNTYFDMDSFFYSDEKTKRTCGCTLGISVEGKIVPGFIESNFNLGKFLNLSPTQWLFIFSSEWAFVDQNNVEDAIARIEIVLNGDVK